MALEKEVNDRREARRKSLANRRVSFAAEATLHTFHEVEYLQDSTTSTDSTRRASSIAGRSPAPQADAPDSPSTPQEQAAEVVPESPANQRDLHQKKRRRSSAGATLDFNNEADNTVSSTVYDSDSGDDVVVENGDEMSTSGSDSDEGDGTMVTVDGDEMTSASVASARTTSSIESTSGLDEVLRLASQRAGSQAEESRRNQVLDDDEEAVPAILGWGKKAAVAPSVARPAPLPQTADAMEEADESAMDMDMTQAAGGIIRSSNVSPPRNQDDDMSMDVTKAFGGIIPTPKAHNPPEFDAEDAAMDEETMEFTTAVGGIRAPQGIDEDQLDSEGNEDMSMELTSVIGGVLGTGATQQSKRQTRRRTIKESDGDDTAMDITVGLGKIWSSNQPERNGDGDATMGMEMTTALGGILPPASPSRARSEARKMMEQEVDQPDAAFTTTPATVHKSPARHGRPTPAKDGNAATASPGLAAFHGKGLRRTPQSKPVTTGTQRRKSPPKQAAETQQPETPVQSSPMRSPKRQSPSPKRQSSPASKSPLKSAPASAGASSVFQQDPSTGAATPRVVLTPQKRRLSGIGIDRPGLGSPKVAQLFDRRESIGDSSSGFVLGAHRGNARKVAFQDPRAMELEVDKERRDEDDKENRRKILEREADGQDDRDATLNLKEMIQNLSPKKNPLKGRKSLHVGSAKGVLGKRPVELDDEEEERDGVKRLKGHQGSPVKNVRLQQPPSKAETTGRVTRSRKTLEADIVTPTITSPTKATSPKGQGRFRDAEADLGSHPIDFAAAQPVDEMDIPDDGEEHIHLQDFLNMTSIRFMELTTTKRRHTVAPAPKRNSAGASIDDVSFEKCVVASVCTVPMLELYQHSCRELKKYISEGRAIVKEIETDTFETNPPLFREYISASPEFRVLMDNQFKNVKSHARLLSKAMWYEWRMKLQDSLKEGLLKTRETLANDDALFSEQQRLLDSGLPAFVEYLEALQQEQNDLETAARELADCDPEELQAARSELTAIDEELEAKKAKIAELRAELERTDSSIGDAKASKQASLEEIQAAEKIREECRGWSSEEISSLKGERSRQEHTRKHANLLQHASKPSRRSTVGRSRAVRARRFLWRTFARLSWFSTPRPSSRDSPTPPSTSGTLAAAKTGMPDPRRSRWISSCSSPGITCGG